MTDQSKTDARKAGSYYDELQAECVRVKYFLSTASLCIGYEEHRELGFQLIDAATEIVEQVGNALDIVNRPKGGEA